MTATAYLLYALALAADLVGAGIAICDLMERVPMLRAFHTETAGQLPMTYNELRSIPETLGDRTPAVIAARMRSGLNEVIDALAAERRAREATDERLAKLSGVGANLGRLKLAGVLLVAGVVLGGVGNIIGQAA